MRSGNRVFGHGGFYPVGDKFFKRVERKSRLPGGEDGF
jgi:hypothetical protein